MKLQVNKQTQLQQHEHLWKQQRNRRLLGFWQQHAYAEHVVRLRDLRWRQKPFAPCPGGEDLHRGACAVAHASTPTTEPGRVCGLAATGWLAGPPPPGPLVHWLPPPQDLRHDRRRQEWVDLEARAGRRAASNQLLSEDRRQGTVFLTPLSQMRVCSLRHTMRTESIEPKGSPS